MPKPFLTFARSGDPLDFSAEESVLVEEARQSIRRVGLPLTVEQIQRKFADYTWFEDHRADPELQCPELRRQWTSLEPELVGLWNYSPREELGHRRPAELYMERLGRGTVSDADLRFCKVAAMPGENADRGFTLTELLVVISILALLGAMAIPALRSALDRADRTVCLSNLRQLGQALVEYTTDHGHYPAAEIAVTDAAGRVVERRRWYHALAPYLGAPREAWSSGQGRVSIDAQSGLAVRVALPSEDDRDQSVLPDVLRCPTVSHWPIGRNGAYGYNHQTLGDARITGAAPDGSGALRRHYPVRRAAVAHPARTIVLMDSAGTGADHYRPPENADSGAVGNHSFTVDPPTIQPRGEGPSRLWASDSPVPGVGPPTLPSRPHARHRGGCCVLFADGRVAWLTAEVLTRDDSLWNGTGRPTAP